MAARHYTGHHSRHFMSTIHVMCRCGGRLVVMMRGNRALTGRAARHLVRPPCVARERRVKQSNNDQADACGNRTAPIETCSWHFVRAFASANFCGPRNLDIECGASQTRFMAHSYIRFDFGMDEEKAQQARHKLDGWRQAFRLDKKLQYKVDRPESAAAETASKAEPVVNTAPPEKSKGKTSEKSRGKAASAKATATTAQKQAAVADGKVGLLVRLYFSSHEKLPEQR